MGLSAAAMGIGSSGFSSRATLFKQGNISVGSGERMYNTPWSANYDRTVIDEGNGERWFHDQAGRLLPAGDRRGGGRGELTLMKDGVFATSRLAPLGTGRSAILVAKREAHANQSPHRSCSEGSA